MTDQTLVDLVDDAPQTANEIYRTQHQIPMDVRLLGSHRAARRRLAQELESLAERGLIIREDDGRVVTFRQTD